MSQKPTLTPPIYLYLLWESKFSTHWTAYNDNTKLASNMINDGRLPYLKSKIISQNWKKLKSRFYSKLVRRFLLTWNTFVLSW